MVISFQYYFGRSVASMPTGIVKPIDPEGRIAIPKALRKLTGIENEDRVDIRLEEKQINIKKHECACVFCGKSARLKEFRQKCVCSECLKNIPEI